MMKTKILIFISLNIALCVVILAFCGVNFALNFAFALFCFYLITAISFILQRKKIQNLIKNATQDELEALAKTYESKFEKQFWQDEEEQEQEAQEPQNTQIPKRKFLDSFKVENIKIGCKAFFLPLRLIAYAFLALGILILIDKNAFNTLAFFTGLISANITIIIFGFYNLFSNK